MTAPTIFVSPYIVGTAVPPEHFHGRASQVREFFRITCGPTLQPLRVLGLRRSGKTSFLLHVAQHKVYAPLVDNSSRTVTIAYVDLQAGITSPAEFFLAVAESINVVLPSPGLQPPVSAEAWRALQSQIAEKRNNLRLIQERQAAYALSVEVPLQLVKEERQLLEAIANLERQLADVTVAFDPNRLPADFWAFKKWMQALLTANHKQHIIVLLDEFEVLTQSPAFDQSFFGSLRALAGPTLFGRFTWVVASYTDLHILSRKFDDKIKTSPLFNIFYYQPVILGSMEAIEVDQLIRTPVEEAGLDFSMGEVEAINQLSGAMPYFVQVTANEWLITRSAAASLADCQLRVLTTLLDPSSQLSMQLESYWKCLTHEERTCLSRVAQAKSLVSENSIAEQKLLRFGLLCEKNGQIQVSGQIFQQWLENNLARLSAETMHEDRATSAPITPHAQSGGVTIQAGTVNITGDVTGRDKIDTK